MTNEAGNISMNAYPHLIPAQVVYIPNISGKSPSSVLSKVKMDGFVPGPGMKITVFDYGMKQKFDTLIGEYFKDAQTGTTENTGKKIATTISCEIAPYIGNTPIDCSEN